MWPRPVHELDVNGFFLEYDDAQVRCFEPLRFVPKGKYVVLGLVTTKRGALETKYELKRRHRRGRALRAARTVVPEPAVRVLLDRGRQLADVDEQTRQAPVVDVAGGLGMTQCRRCRTQVSCGAGPAGLLLGH